MWWAIQCCVMTWIGRSFRRWSGAQQALGIVVAGTGSGRAEAVRQTPAAETDTPRQELYRGAHGQAEQARKAVRAVEQEQGKGRRRWRRASRRSRRSSLEQGGRAAPVAHRGTQGRDEGQWPRLSSLHCLLTLECRPIRKWTFASPPSHMQ